MEKNEVSINARVAIYVPLETISLLKKTFSLKDVETESFIISLIDKVTTENTSQSGSYAFTTEETKEIEDNLNGLGYI